jgi:hypothetical protein
VSEFADKVRTLGVLSGGRTRTRVVEGRQHPQTGVPFKTTITDAGRVTEHATRDDRVDAVATPMTVTVTRAQIKEQADGR